jgi:hypothetical protein
MLFLGIHEKSPRFLMYYQKLYGLCVRNVKKQFCFYHIKNRKTNLPYLWHCVINLTPFLFGKLSGQNSVLPNTTSSCSKDSASVVLGVTNDPLFIINKNNAYNVCVILDLVDEFCTQYTSFLRWLLIFFFLFLKISAVCKENVVELG